jgi:hypothetical protein
VNYQPYPDYGYHDWSDSFHFYSCAGSVTDGEWYHNDHSYLVSPFPFWEVEPEPQSPDILHLIGELGGSEEAEEKLIVLGPHRGVCLCLEGLIQARHFELAIQTKRSIIDDYVDIPNVWVGDHQYTVRVVNGDKYHLAIADRGGRVLSE